MGDAKVSLGVEGVSEVVGEISREEKNLGFVFNMDWVSWDQHGCNLCLI